MGIRVRVRSDHVSLTACLFGPSPPPPRASLRAAMPPKAKGKGNDKAGSSKEKVDKTFGMKNKKGKAVAAKFQTGPGQVSREETCARTHTSTRARAHTRWRWRDCAVVRCSGVARTHAHAQRLSRTRSFFALVWCCAVRWERLAALRCHLLAAASSFVSPCVGFLVRTHIRHICARARALSLSSLSPLSLLSLYSLLSSLSLLSLYPLSTLSLLSLSSLLSPRSNTAGRRTTLPRRRMTS